MGRGRGIRIGLRLFQDFMQESELSHFGYKIHYLVMICIIKATQAYGHLFIYSKETAAGLSKLMTYR